MRMDRSAFCRRRLGEQFKRERIGRHVYKVWRRALCRRIAGALVRARTKQPIITTTTLAEVVYQNVPPLARHKRIHPATRIFQALRIAVNANWM